MEKYEYKLLKYVCSSLDYEIFILTFNAIIYSFFYVYFFYFFFLASISISNFSITLFSIVLY